LSTPTKKRLWNLSWKAIFLLSGDQVGEK